MAGAMLPFESFWVCSAGDLLFLAHAGRLKQSEVVNLTGKADVSNRVRFAVQISYAQSWSYFHMRELIDLLESSVAVSTALSAILYLALARVDQHPFEGEHSARIRRETRNPEGTTKSGARSGDPEHQNHVRT